MEINQDKITFRWGNFLVDSAFKGIVIAGVSLASMLTYNNFFAKKEVTIDTDAILQIKQMELVAASFTDAEQIDADLAADLILKDMDNLLQEYAVQHRVKIYTKGLVWDVALNNATDDFLLFCKNKKFVK